MKRVAIQGVAGAFHDVAARGYFKGEEIELLPCDTFKILFDRVKHDPALIGIVAIENTIAGSLLPNHHMLYDSGLVVVGEYKLRIEHCIAALPGECLEGIREVHSHPIALMQCEEFFDAHKHLLPVESVDTAMSARDVAEKQLKGVAAVCSRLAAEMYGLTILQEGIETNKRNFTRFLIIAGKEQAPLLLEHKKLNKSTLTFTLPHEEGSLAQVLSILSFYKLNLTKIQSLPIIGREWEYQFYIALEFNNIERFHQGVSAVAPLLKDFKMLGEYEAFQQP